MTSAINLSETQYISSLSGFKNKTTLTFAVDVPSYSLNAGDFVQIIANTTFNDPSVIGNLSSVRIMYDGIDNFWRFVDGFVFAEYPNSGAPTYEIGSLTYFTSTYHSLFTYLANETGGVINSPAFTLRCTIDVYDMPFVQ